jgi:oligosaccharide repeat unit polymerase
LNKGRSIAFFLTAIVIVSLVAAWFIGNLPELQNESDFYNFIYTSIILFFLFHGFSKYKRLNFIYPSVNQKSFLFFQRIILVGGLFVFIVNLYVVYKSFGLILVQSIDVEEFKNEGGAAEYLNRWIGGPLLFVTRFFSPLGYLALGLHFYYLGINKGLKSALFFLVALNIPLQGLQALSRSATTQFIIMYFMFYMYARGTMSKKMRKGITKVAIITGAVIIYILVVITNTRFSERYGSSENNKIENKSLYSVFDYSSQWVKNNFKVMSEYDQEKMIYGRSSLSLYYYVRQRIGYDDRSLGEEKIRVLGRRQASRFNGVAASFLYDFGYFFGLIMAVVFFLLVRSNAPMRGRTTIFSFLSFAVLMPLPAMFFGNNVYSSIAIQLAAFYLLLFWIISKIKIFS